MLLARPPPCHGAEPKTVAGEKRAGSGGARHVRRSRAAVGIIGDCILGSLATAPQSRLSGPAGRFLHDHPDTQLARAEYPARDRIQRGVPGRIRRVIQLARLTRSRKRGWRTSGRGDRAAEVSTTNSTDHTNQRVRRRIKRVRRRRFCIGLQPRVLDFPARCWAFWRKRSLGRDGRLVCKSPSQAGPIRSAGTNGLGSDRSLRTFGRCRIAD
jgi:hypothetical protein